MGATIGIGVMCKPPRPGVSKTRLAAAVGAEAAAALAAAFLTDVLATVAEAAAAADLALRLFHKPAGAEAELAAYAPPGTPFTLQDDGDLGDAMAGALGRLLQDHPAGAILIGADIPTLDPASLVEAAALLRAGESDAVFGPSEDGGYFLVGCRDVGRIAPLLAPMAWSTSEVMARTRSRAAAHGLALQELGLAYDVDDAGGLDRLARDLATLPPSRAWATRAALARLRALAPQGSGGR